MTNAYTPTQRAVPTVGRFLKRHDFDPTVPVHIYELSIDIRQPDGQWQEFTTVFVSTYADRDAADEEAREAAKVWGTNIHTTVRGTRSAADWNVHIRQGVGVTWFDDDEFDLVNPDYRHVGIVKL